MSFIAEKIGDFCERCGEPIVPGDEVAGGPRPKPLYHIGCWPTVSQAPRSPGSQAGAEDGSGFSYEFELSTKRDPAPERRVLKVICPRGTSVTQLAELMQAVKEFLRAR